MDIDIFQRNSELFNLIKEFEFEQVYTFFKHGMSVEKNKQLKKRWCSYKDRILPKLNSLNVTNKQDNEDFAIKWADYMYYRNCDINLFTLFVNKRDFYLNNFKCNGIEKLKDYMQQGINPILVASHTGPYQAIIPALASQSIEFSYFMDKNSVELWNEIIQTYLEDYRELLHPIGLPSKNSIKQGIVNLKKGLPLLIFPEFSFYESNELTTNFFNKEIKVPIGSAKLASKYNLPLIPITFERNNFTFELTIHDSIRDIDDQRSIDVIATETMKWVENRVKDNMTEWWCWEIFESLMQVEENHEVPTI